MTYGNVAKLSGNVIDAVSIEIANDINLKVNSRIFFKIEAYGIYLCVNGYMVRFILIITAIALASCSDGKLKKYQSIVREADRFEVYYKSTNKTIAVPKQTTANFKDILARNVNPETQRKFINDVKIDIYKGNKQIAFLMVTNGGKSPFVNFNSDKLNFGFQLTYGIGQTIDNLYSDNSR
jgi:hypothetical protein